LNITQKSVLSLAAKAFCTDCSIFAAASSFGAGAGAAAAGAANTPSMASTAVSRLSKPLARRRV